MKKTIILILSFACMLSAAAFAACNKEEGGSGGSSVQETCQHDFADGTFACEDRVCLTCGEKVQVTEAHTYIADGVVAPTCEENGYTLKKCACGATQKSDTVEKLGHDFGEYVETVEASCKTVGVSTAECSRCGATDHTYTPALDHQFDEAQDIVKAATCTENGFTRHVCTECKEVILDSYVRAFGHTSDGENDVTVLPTCEDEGYDSHKCGVCQTVYTDNFVEASGHSWIDGEVQAASCSSVGYTQEECSVCHTSRMNEYIQKSAHTFENGKCTACGKESAAAFGLSAVNEAGGIVYIRSDDANGLTRYVLNGIGDREKTYVTLEKEVVEALIADGYSGLTLRFYNPDDLLRLYVWKVTGLHTEEKMANNFQAYGYSDTCVQYISFYNDDGELSSIVKDGMAFMLYHTVASGSNSAVANSLALEIEYHKPFNVNDKSTWFSSTDNKSGSVQYVEGKGWKATATGSADYSFAMVTELLAKQIEDGKTTLTITFGGAFDDADFGDGNPVNCKVWIIPKNAASGSDDWAYNVSWISGFTNNGDGTYSVTIDLTDSTYDFTQGMFFHVSYKDVLNTDIGACYLHDVVFS